MAAAIATLARRRMRQPILLSMAASCSTPAQPFPPIACFPLELPAQQSMRPEQALYIFTQHGLSRFQQPNQNPTLTLTGTNTGYNTLAPVIGDNSGATSLVKSGTGTWVLTGSNTFSGTTTINAGTLKLASAGSVLGSTSSDHGQFRRRLCCLVRAIRLTTARPYS